MRPIPLLNIGNTCYINSVLQCILYQKEFQEKIETEVEEKYKQTQPQIQTNEDAEKYKERYKQVKSQNDYIIKLLEEQKKENDKLASKLKAIENAAKKDKSKK